MKDNILELLTKITLEEFSDYLANKEISSKCLRCNKQALQINVQEGDSGSKFIRAIYSHIQGDEQSIFPFYMRTCSNCASVEYYSGTGVLSDIQKNRNKTGIENER